MSLPVTLFRPIPVPYQKHWNLDEPCIVGLKQFSTHRHSRCPGATFNPVAAKVASVGTGPLQSFSAELRWSRKALLSLRWKWLYLEIKTWVCQRLNDQQIEYQWLIFLGAFIHHHLNSPLDSHSQIVWTAWCWPNSFSNIKKNILILILSKSLSNILLFKPNTHTHTHTDRLSIDGSKAREQRHVSHWSFGPQRFQLLKDQPDTLAISRNQSNGITWSSQASNSNNGCGGCVHNHRDRESVTCCISMNDCDSMQQIAGTTVDDVGIPTWNKRSTQYSSELAVLSYPIEQRFNLPALVSTNHG